MHYENYKNKQIDHPPMLEPKRLLERNTRTFEDKIQTRVLLTRPSLKYSRQTVVV